MAGMKTQNTHIAINEIGSQALNVNDGSVPEIVPLMSVGRNDGRDGRTFFVSNAEEVIKATDAFRGNADLLLDYNHQSEYARENGRPAPASGWMKNFVVQDGFICAVVEWTPKARELIKNKEFRFISPVFIHKNGEVVRIVSAALTNSPNFELKALNQQEKEQMDTEETALCQALGVSDAQTALPRIAGLQEAERALNEVAQALNCDCSAQAILTAARNIEPDKAKYVSTTEYAKACNELAALKREREDEKAANIVEKAINEGRLPPALKENALAMAKTQGETALNEWLTLIKPVSGKDAPTDAPALKTDTLTAEDKAVCQSLGLTEEEFKKGMENA